MVQVQVRYFSSFFILYICVCVCACVLSCVNFIFHTGQGGIFTYMACMMTTAANFPPKVRGTVIGLVDSMYGGSAAIFSAIYNQTYGKADSPYQQNVAGFFYAGGVITMAVSMFLFATLWWIPWKERQTLDQNDPVRSAASAGIEEPRTDFPLSNGEFKQQQLQRSVQTGNQSAALDGSCDSNNVSSQVEGNAYSPLRRVTSTSSESARSRALQNEGASLLAPTAQEDNNSDLNTLQLFTNGNFQLLFWSFALSTGVGLMFMSNVLFFLKAYRLEVQYRGLFTVLLPICSLVSRFLSGVISDALHVRHISRSMLLLLTISALLVAQILLLIWPQKITVLLVNVVTVGVSYGSMWCLVPTMMTTIGGLKYFGQNWGMVMLSSALLGMGYQALYGKVYDEHVPASTHTPPLVMSSLDGDSPTASTCYGPQCFAITTYTTVASCALSLLFLLVLFVRDQRQLLRRKNQVR